MLKESLTNAFKGPFTFKKSIVFQHFAPVFLEKLSLISLLKSDCKLQFFAFFTLSNIQKILIFQKKKRNKVSISHVIWLRGSGGGPGSG